MYKTGGWKYKHWLTFKNFYPECGTCSVIYSFKADATHIEVAQYSGQIKRTWRWIWSKSREVLFVDENWNSTLFGAVLFCWASHSNSFFGFFYHDFLEMKSRSRSHLELRDLWVKSNFHYTDSLLKWETKYFRPPGSYKKIYWELWSVFICILQLQLVN